MLANPSQPNVLTAEVNAVGEWAVMGMRVTLVPGLFSSLVIVVSFVNHTACSLSGPYVIGGW
jgi:hypothetical protein